MTPRLLVRNGSQYKLLQHEKCELVFGDIENNNAVKPEATAKNTKFVPRNNPNTYRNDFLKPYAAPKPAVLNTPGPGVTINRNTEMAKVSMQLSS